MKIREGLSEQYPNLINNSRLTQYYNDKEVLLLADIAHKILIQVSYGAYYIRKYKSIESLRSAIIKDKIYFAKIA